jgi:hypothetical protein
MVGASVWLGAGIQVMAFIVGFAFLTSLAMVPKTVAQI